MKRPPRLSPADLEDLAALEYRVGLADNVQLKLEWGVLRTGQNVTAFTERAGRGLVGFLGIYSFDPAEAELIGMVDPDHRRRGIATALLDRALAYSGARGFAQRLLIVPRTAAPAAALAAARGAGLHHSEHSLVLDGDPERAPEQPEVTLRQATDADRPDLVRILTAGFGPPPEAMLAQLRSETFATLLIERAGVPVGTLRADLDGEQGGVYGFAIAPAERGRGIGRDVLGRVCAELRSRGAGQVRLQVEVDNDAALHLYTSLGFVPVGTEDYYLLPS